jgi:hypothetical protein
VYHWVTAIRGIFNLKWDRRIYVREVDCISVLLRIAGVGGIHNEITGKLCDRKIAPINQERAVLTSVGKLLLGVTTFSLRQICWG